MIRHRHELEHELPYEPTEEAPPRHPLLCLWDRVTSELRHQPGTVKELARRLELPPAVVGAVLMLGVRIGRISSNPRSSTGRLYAFGAARPKRPTSPRRPEQAPPTTWLLEVVTTWLGEHPGASSREAAEGLRLPVADVRDALRELGATGRAERHGCEWRLTGTTP